jgi:hypothetical protein
MNRFFVAGRKWYKYVTGDSILRGLEPWKQVTIDPHSGANINDLIRKLKERRNYIARFDVLATLIATNDIGQGRSLEDIQYGFRKLVETIRDIRLDMTIVILGVLPRPCGGNQEVKQLNASLER